MATSRPTLDSHETSDFNPITNVPDLTELGFLRYCQAREWSLPKEGNASFNLDLLCPCHRLCSTKIDSAPGPRSCVDSPTKVEDESFPTFESPLKLAEPKKGHRRWVSDTDALKFKTTSDLFGDGKDGGDTRSSADKSGADRSDVRRGSRNISFSPR